MVHIKLSWTIVEVKFSGYIRENAQERGHVGADLSIVYTLARICNTVRETKAYTKILKYYGFLR